MQSGARLIAPLEAVPYRASSARYVCSSCRRQFLPRCTAQPLLNLQSRRHNSSDSNNNNNPLPFSEKVRRKIWGTDNPPGLKDPYGGESFLEKRLREKREAKAAVEGAQREAELEQPEYVAEEQLTTAATGAPAAVEAAEYIPATTWESLEHVGTSGKWWEYPPTHADQFAAFIHRGKMTGHDEFLTALHQAAVELCIMKGVNKPSDKLCEILEHEERVLALINRVEVKPGSEPGLDALIFPDTNAKEALLEFFREFDSEPVYENAESASENEPAEAVSESAAPSKLAELDIADMEIRTPESSDFLSLPLGDRTLQFAFLKRASQLTGYRVPDPEIPSMTTVSSLLKYLTEASKPKPAKLADILIAEGKFAALPNVKIFDRRQTPIDHEKEVGRWKVIEEELTKRGLPVTGRLSQ